jgi:uncharacterized protein YbjT (DUF2867 family)
MSNATILVIGSTGKTGKRVVSRLEDRGLAVRHGSRPAAITYSPDLAVPGSVDAIRGLTELAEDVAACARFVTGEILHVDSGQSAGH